MTWTGDRRTSTGEWRRARLRILDRDQGVCYVCRKPGADEVDHIRNVAECRRLGINPDTDDNLGAIHSVPCHRAKTQREASEARWRHRSRRPNEPHPGIVEP